MKLEGIMSLVRFERKEGAPLADWAETIATGCLWAAHHSCFGRTVSVYEDGYEDQDSPLCAISRVALGLLAVTIAFPLTVFGLIVQQFSSSYFKHLDANQKADRELWEFTAEHLTDQGVIDIQAKDKPGLPQKIGQLGRRLKELNVIGKNIENIPRGFGKLSALEILKLDFNPISKLPCEFRKLSSLKELDLMSTPLQQFPIVLTDLENLERLHMSTTKDSRIKKIPAEIGKLTKLTHLNLAFHEIEEIPREIEKLRSLKHLNLSFNPIQDLPDEICNLPSTCQITFLQLPKINSERQPQEERIARLKEKVSQLQEKIKVKGSGPSFQIEFSK